MPQGVTLSDFSETKVVKTLCGQPMAWQVVILHDILISEFDKNKCITQQKAFVFNNDSCQYDMILGMIFLSKIGIKLGYGTGHMQFYNSM